jgi:hypothetical protein
MHDELFASVRVGCYSASDRVGRAVCKYKKCMIKTFLAFRHMGSGGAP